MLILDGCGTDRVAKWGSVWREILIVGGLAMKGLTRWGLVAVFIVATALPATAKSWDEPMSWDVCLDNTDLNTSGTVTVRSIVQPEFFAAAASIYPSALSLLRQQSH
jgi:hypothetical protein